MVAYACFQHTHLHLGCTTKRIRPECDSPWSQTTQSIASRATATATLHPLSLAVPYCALAASSIRRHDRACSVNSYSTTRLRHFPSSVSLSLPLGLVLGVSSLHPLCWSRSYWLGSLFLSSYRLVGCGMLRLYLLRLLLLQGLASQHIHILWPEHGRRQNGGRCHRSTFN